MSAGPRGRDDLLSGDGRTIGHAVDALGVTIERLGIWIQAQAAELRFRRLSALRRWGQ